MKKYTYFIYSLLFLLTTLVACDREKIDYGLDENEGIEEGIGKLSLSFPLETRASGNFDDFLIKIVNSAGETEEEYIYGQMPDMIELNAGTYTVQAESPNFDPAQPSNNPYYKGSQSFTIKKDEITLVNTVVCTMQNIKVEMLLAESLESILETYEVTATFIGDGGQTMSFSYDQNNTGLQYTYFPEINEGGQHVLTVQLTGTTNSENGSKTVNLGKTYSDVAAGEYRRITFTYSANAGSGDINLDIDAECEIVDKNIVVPGIPTDPDPGPGPGDGDGEIEIIGFSFDGEEFDINESVLIPYESEEKTLIVKIKANKGIQNLIVEIQSIQLVENGLLGMLGLTPNFDLANPGENLAALKLLGFPTEDEVIGEEEIDFDVTAFTALLAEMDPEEHSFIIKVIDMEGTPAEATLKIKVVE